MNRGNAPIAMGGSMIASKLPAQATEMSQGTGEA